jgi:hypothetical protein
LRVAHDDEKEGDNVADQDKDQLDDRVEKVEKRDEPDVEAHKLEGRVEKVEKLDEPDVEAHRFDKFEGRT